MRNAPFRLLRTVFVGATVLGLAAGAHLVAGGSLPAPAIMAALLALHVLCSTVATHFRLALPAMMILLGSSQVVLHQVFEKLSSSATAGPGSAGPHQHTMSAEENAAALLVSAQAVATPGMDHMNHAGAVSGWMWAAHIIATVAAAALLAYGENALWSLAHWLRPLHKSPAAVLALPAQAARPGVIPRPLPRRPWRNLRPDTRRGPPA
ncbi:hypothetical protein ACX80E_00390 [Arthrobacter sp. TMN-49]